MESAFPLGWAWGGVDLNILLSNVVTQMLRSANHLHLLAVNDETRGLCLHFGISQQRISFTTVM